jgi:hypothetical protein
MIRAIVCDGKIHPVEPLPPSWEDGQPVEVQAAPSEADEFDDAMREIKRLSQQIDDEDWQRMRTALEEADRQAKELVRKQMGLD